MNKFDEAKRICKAHGIKGFRKLKLKRTVYHAGRQCQRMDVATAQTVLAELVELGFDFTNCEHKLAAKGLLDVITLS